MYGTRKQVEVDVKTGRIKEAMSRYCMGRDKTRSVAKDAGAVIKVGKVCLYDFAKMDRYLESLAGR